MSRTLYLTLCLFMFFGFYGLADAQFSMSVAPEQELNNLFSTAQIIETPISTTRGAAIWPATLTPTGDLDYYQFEISAFGTYSIRVDSTRDTFLTLYNQLLQPIATNNDSGNPDTPNDLDSGLTLLLPPGIYFLQVRYAIPTGVARYALRIFPGIDARDYDPTEPNNTHQQAINLGTFSGEPFVSPGYGFSSYGGGDVDVYRIHVPASGTVLQFRTLAAFDTTLRVFSPDGMEYFNDDDTWDELNGRASQISIIDAPAGVYWVHVSSYGQWGGYYNLLVRAELPNEFSLTDATTVMTVRGIRDGRESPNVGIAGIRLRGANQMHQNWWWYRVDGVNAREYALSSLVRFRQPLSSRVILTYEEPENLWINIQYNLRQGTTGTATVTQLVELTNTGNVPRTIHLFKYMDYDLAGTPTNDQAGWSNGRLRVVDPLSQDYVELDSRPQMMNWQVIGWPHILDMLANAEINNLTNRTLPFEGDYTGCAQWAFSLAPGETRMLRVHEGFNIPTRFYGGDVNMDYCVNDGDLLEILFDFGRTGFGLLTDLNNDGVVNDADMLLVLLDFGLGDCGF
jgi:hypothetical protein